MIQVKAMKMGYYDIKRMKEGAIFNIRSEKEFSSNWMQKIDDSQKSSKIAATKASSKKSDTLFESDVI